jgi:alkylation response protein AidB-like acyl-CoA dehydrogenase
LLRKKAAREFAEEKFRPVARDLDARGVVEDRLWNKAAELGFLVVFVPVTCGRLGPG